MGLNEGSVVGRSVGAYSNKQSKAVVSTVRVTQKQSHHRKEAYTRRLRSRLLFQREQGKEEFVVR